jgi:hypothetical protein
LTETTLPIPRPEFDRSINLEPAQCLIEAQGQVLRLAVGWGQGGLLVLEQFVGIFLGRRLVVGTVFRRTEGNAADQQGGQDSVLTAKPLAPTLTSTPLAFQKRVFSVTY